MSVFDDQTARALALFFAAAIDHMQDGWDWDGFDMQAAAQKAGLTVQRDYDPATDDGMDAEEGDMVWVASPLGLAALNAVRANATNLPSQQDREER